MEKTWQNSGKNDIPWHAFLNNEEGDPVGVRLGAAVRDGHNNNDVGQDTVSYEDLLNDRRMIEC
jgi:hypothetical protein